MGALNLQNEDVIRSNLHALLQNVTKVIYGKEDAITQIICSWVCGGHVLLEDLPGTGKTMLARTLAKSVSVDFKRTQFTPDLLPSDIVGLSILNRQTQEFEFRPGPIFTGVFLADEINRATPRTQSALLEAMSEKQVTVDGTTRKLDPCFFVIATENPIEQAGTFPLPEAQMDRFFIQLGLGYPSDQAEREIVLSQKNTHPIEFVQPVLTSQDLLDAREQAERIEVSETVLQYALGLVKNTRTNDLLAMGASPRASIALIKLAKVFAFMRGDSFLTPDHIQVFAPAVLSHRLMLTPEARFSGHNRESVVEQILKSVPVPVGL